MGRAHRIVVIALLSASVASAACGSGSATAVADDSPRTITVTATGRYSANPNVVAVDFIVRSEAPESAAAVEAAQKRVAGLKTALGEVGVEYADMLSIEDGLEQDTVGQGVGRRRVFRSRHVLRATLRDVLLLPDLLAAAAARGTESLGEVRYGLGAPELMAERARVAAHAQALAGAEVIASEAGLSLGDVLSVVEEAAPPWPLTPLTEPSPYEITVTLTVTWAVSGR